VKLVASNPACAGEFEILTVTPLADMRVSWEAYAHTNATYPDPCGIIELLAPLGLDVIPGGARGFRISWGLGLSLKTADSLTPLPFVVAPRDVMAKSPLRLSTAISIVSSGSVSDVITYFDNLSPLPYSITTPFL